MNYGSCSDDIQARVPPSDIPAEASVLGAMMVYSDCVTKVREILTEDQFYRPAHQIIYRAICWMAEHPAKFGVPDLVTLRAALAQRGKLVAVGGVEYLVGLAQGVPTAANVKYYAGIVADKARLRGLIVASALAGQAAYGNEDADEILSEAARTIAEATKTRHVCGGSSAAEVHGAIEQAISGTRVSIDWPWNCITHWGRSCAPGAVTVLCGDPGSGKSFLFQEAMLFWHRRKIPTAMLHLEKNRRYHQIRALGQLAGCNSILSDQWQAANPDRARETMEAHWTMLDSYGATVWDDPDGAMSLDQVQAWISARATDGARIIGVDPITAAETGQRPWESDRRLIVSCESLAARHGCSIVLITHPRNANNSAPSIDSLAGGRAFGRLTDCVLWLQRHDPPLDAEVRMSCGPAMCQFNRTVSLCKTRDGVGQGLSFALNFDGESLSVHELGLLTPKPKRKRKEDEENE